MPRLSLVEQYDNKDVIQQILKLKTLVYEGTIKDINVTSSDGSIHFEFTMNDDSVQTFDIPDDYIVDVDISQSGADVTLTFTFASGLTDSTTFSVTAVGYTTAVANTLAQRDANARLVAADPASGATDGTLVTANWVSQTGNSSPNNIVHRSGDEDISGDKMHISVSTSAGPVGFKRSGMVYPPVNDASTPMLQIVDSTGTSMGQLYLRTLSSGVTVLYTALRNSNGTWKYIALASGDVI